MSAQPLQAPSAPAHRTSAQAVSSYWRAWSEHNLNDLLELLAPDFISRSSLSQGRATGKEAIAKGFAMFDKALPDLREEITSLVTADNSVVCEVEETATFTGPMHLGAHVIAPTNRSYTLPVASFFRINAQGLIAEQRTYWDTASWAKQLGVDPVLFSPEAVSCQHPSDLVQAFTAAFTSDDVESFYRLVSADAEWVIMATGETFRGLDQIKQLTQRSVAARTHRGGLGIKPTNVFASADGARFCWEYVHTGIVTDKWPASSLQRPAPGSTFELPIILVAEILEGKIIKMREYFDLLTLTGSGAPHHLYS
jgi:steroid delta-isomerase-like uncharacterized protein